MWPALEAMAHTASYDAAIMAGHVSGSPLPPQWAEWVTIPTLLMDGENSAPWQHRSVRALADVLPHARRETFPDADHASPRKPWFRRCANSAPRRDRPLLTGSVDLAALQTPGRRPASCPWVTGLPAQVMFPFKAVAVPRR